MKILEIEELSIALEATGKALVRGASLSIGEGERVALIGESGSGKSMTALAALGLLPTSMRASGRVRLCGVDMIGAPEEERQAVRGAGAAIVFQEPLAALDPLMKIGRQIEGPLALHRGLRGRAARAAAVELLLRVKIKDAERVADSYPHEISGGQRQRAAIAMALGCGPRLLVADEPTTALDATVQAEVVALLDEIIADTGMALLFITHDLALAARIATRIVVMKEGRFVESGTAGEIVASPRAAYTRSLLAAARRSSDYLRWGRDGRNR